MGGLVSRVSSADIPNNTGGYLETDDLAHSDLNLTPGDNQKVCNTYTYNKTPISNSRNDGRVQAVTTDTRELGGSDNYCNGNNTTRDSSQSRQSNYLFFTPMSSSSAITEKCLGLHNFGNTCYCNSVLQVLYHYSPFRAQCLKHRNDGDGMLGALSELFQQIESQKKSRNFPCTGTCVAPKKFIQKLGQQSEMFRGAEHHDAHEFFNFLINDISEYLIKRRNAAAPSSGNYNSSCSAKSAMASSPAGTYIGRPALGHTSGEYSSVPRQGRCAFESNAPPTASSTTNKSSNGTTGSSKSNRILYSNYNTRHDKKSHNNHPSFVNGSCSSSSNSKTKCPRPLYPPVPSTTWIRDLFEGTLLYKTRCLACENVTQKSEPFIDLSVEVEQNCNTLETCIHKFASKEKLMGKDKYFCDVCSCLQEAERSSRLGRLPPFLAVHLKRFKFDEAHNRFSRLPHRVEFPLTLTLECEDPDAPTKHFTLFAVIVHVGLNVTHGHYICCVLSHGSWYLFDDHVVTSISAESLKDFYGAAKESEGTRCGYLFFYCATPQASLPQNLLPPVPVDAPKKTEKTNYIHPPNPNPNPTQLDGGNDGVATYRQSSCSNNTRSSDSANTATQGPNGVNCSNGSNATCSNCSNGPNEAAHFMECSLINNPKTDDGNAPSL